MPKTVKELTEAVLSYGFSSRNYEALIRHWIDEAQRNMFRQAGLRIKHRDYEFSTISGVKEYDLPTDFGSSISLRDLEDTSEGELIRFRNIEEYDDAEKSEGIPSHYIIDNISLFLYPTPNLIRKLSFRYNLIPSAIAEAESSDPSIGEDFYYLIEIYCLYKAFQKESDIEMANHYKGVYDSEMIEFVGLMNTDVKDSTEQVEGAWGYQ